VRDSKESSRNGPNANSGRLNGMSGSVRKSFKKDKSLRHTADSHNSQTLSKSVDSFSDVGPGLGSYRFGKKLDTALFE
jgi:hypothetical protein